MVKIDQNACIGCAACAQDCISGVLSLKDKKAVQNGSCILCGHCVAICPVRAVSIPAYDMTDVEDAWPEEPAITPRTLLHAIKMRRSVRLFRDRPIDREVLEQIIQAGRYTATAVNYQDCRFLVVQEDLKTLKEKIWSGLEKELTSPAPSETSYMFLQFYQRRLSRQEDDYLFRNAPAVLFIASDMPVDAALASQNMELMAVAQGLGAMYNGYLVRAVNADEEVSRWLGIGEKKLVVCMLLGYPEMKYLRCAPRRKADVVWK